MKKYRYNINNLDCAMCAKKIEDELNKTKNIENAIVNFNTSKISFSSKEDISVKELNKIIKKIEPSSFILDEEVKKEYHLEILILALLIGLAAYFLKLPSIIKTILLIISYILLLYKTGTKAIKLLIKSKTINENLLITISCIGAFLINEPLEGMMVITLYTIGKILEEKAVNNSRKSIKGLIDLKQPYANKKIKDEIIKVDVEEIKVNDILLIKKGEKIPVDGIITKGNTKLDNKSLTGESAYITVKEKDKVLSGSINKENIIYIKATSEYSNSTVSKILELLETATDKKTKTENMVNKISKIYTPIVLIISILIAVILPLFNINFTQSIYRALTFLVISCPCAIAISVPLSYFTAIGVSGKKCILVKGSNYLDSLSNVKNIIFDKTGTLTTGSYEIDNIEILDKNFTKKQIIEILRKGESLSNHPIAKSIIQLDNKKIDNKDVKNFKEETGQGIKFTIDNMKIKIGNKKICNCNNDGILHLNINNKHIATININDGIKKEAKKTIEDLKEMKINTLMFTGDKKEIANIIGKNLNIDDIRYEMLPTDKYKEYEKIAQKDVITAFVGDGINDAIVLKRSDIGISMGNLGSEEAIEASDIVLMKDDLSKIPMAIKISKYTKHIIKQNLIFAISVKLIILLLSILGLANMWFAVFADTGVTLLTIINTLRIIRKFK